MQWKYNEYGECTWACQRQAKQVLGDKMQYLNAGMCSLFYALRCPRKIALPVGMKLLFDPLPMPRKFRENNLGLPSKNPPKPKKGLA